MGCAFDQDTRATLIGAPLARQENARAVRPKWEYGRTVDPVALSGKRLKTHPKLSEKWRRGSGPGGPTGQNAG
jgi:hypothetical protein